MDGTEVTWQDFITVEDKRALVAIRENPSGLQEALADIAARKKDNSGVSHLDIVGRLTHGTALLKQLSLGRVSLGDDRSASQPDFILLPSKTATSITLVFSGNQAKFSLPFELVLGFDTHIVLLRDRRRSFCLAGLSGLGSDTKCASKT